MIYWDHNSTTPCAPEVVDAMQRYWNDEYGNPSSSHIMGRRASLAIKKAREQVSGLMQSESSEIVFTSGATESNNLLFLGVLLTPRSERNRIAVSAIEHKSVLEPARMLEERGFEVVKIPVSRGGVTDLAAARDLINDETLLVSVQAANNEIGTLQPVGELADIAHENGAYFHTDAAQVLGKVPFDVQTVHCDFASFSAHKMYGPKGIGALFVRGGARRWPWAYPFRGGGQESGLRPGTSNVPAIVGFGEACSLGRQFIQEQGYLDILRTENVLLSRIRADFPDSIIHADDTHRLPGVFSVSFPNIPADLLIDHLQVLALGRGAACSNGSLAFSHVLNAIGINADMAATTLRISLGRNSTIDDVILSEVALRQGAAYIKQVYGSLVSE